jgi:hypothetical protein
MSENRFVLHIRSYYPEDYYFEDFQYYNDDGNYDGKHLIYQDNNDGRNFSVIIYYDNIIQRFVLLTDNIIFMKKEDNTYTTTHKYNEFTSANISHICLLLRRMSFGLNNESGISGTYNLHNLLLREYTEYTDLEKQLKNANQIAFLETYILGDDTIESELEMIKDFSNQP